MTIVHCNSYGVPLRLELSGDALLPCLPNLLPFATEIGSPPSADAHPFTLAPGISQAQFAREIMIHVANFAPDHVFVHAGVVAWNDRALLLPGPSFAGKTTLTAALVRAGATYYSDEYAVVDEDGAIHPYPRDLQMREPGTTSQTSLPVASLCGKAGALPLRAATIFFTRYRPGARWDPQPVTHGMALLEMLRHTIPVQRTPARVMATLSRMLEGTTAWASDRDDAHSTAKLLLATFQQEETEQREMHQQPLDRRQIANETSHAGAGPV